MPALGRFLPVWFACAALLAAGAAHALVLDFSSGAFSAQSANGLVNRYAQDGFEVRTQSVAGAFEPAFGSYAGQLRWNIDSGFVSDNVIVIDRGGASFDLLSVQVVAAFSGLQFQSSKGGVQTAGGANAALMFSGDPWRGVAFVTVSQVTSPRILNVLDDIAVQAAPIPEPGTAALLLLGGAGVLAYGRRRRR
jgi:hypothetical protein